MEEESVDGRSLSVEPEYLEEGDDGTSFGEMGLFIPDHKVDELYSQLQREPAALQDLARLPAWNAAIWSRWYLHYSKMDPKEGPRMLRRLVWKTTKAICTRKAYLYEERPADGDPRWRVVRLDADWASQSRQTKFYDFGSSSPQILKDAVLLRKSQSPLPKHNPEPTSTSVVVEGSKVVPMVLKPNYSTEINVVSADCLEVGLYLKKKLSLNPVVLNMASPRQPGGGYKTGAGAQEENLFRRTSYYHSLVDPQGHDAARAWHYPLPEFCAVYSPSVVVFRKSESDGYALMPSPQILSFVAVSAYRTPALVPGTPKNPEPSLAPKVAEKLFFKVYQILYVALMEGHDSVVLSALGCGAYANPPGHVAKIFHRVIHLPEFRGVFRNITFAILEDANCFKKHNPKGNLGPFRRIFNTTLQNESYYLGDLYGDEVEVKEVQKPKSSTNIERSTDGCNKPKSSTTPNKTKK